MQRLVKYAFLMTVLFSAALFAQEIEPNEIEPYQAQTFPLALILEAGGFTGMEALTWQPNWPLDFPPDAFTARPDSPKIKRILIFWEGSNLNYQFFPDGRIEEFPFMLDNGIISINVTYREGELNTMHFSPRPEASYTFEFLENQDSFPSIVRVSHAGYWFFVSLLWGENKVIETWYNEEAEPLGAYVYSLISIGKLTRIKSLRDYSPGGVYREFNYNSLGLVSEAILPGGEGRVLYNAFGQPGYWERLFSDAYGRGSLSFQLDPYGLLLGTRGIAEEEQVNYRYDYSFDANGNWTMRRETRMIPYMGFFFPSPGRTINRVLEYFEAE